MAEFDETLSGILSNPAAMAQIAQLAQSLQFGGTPGGPTPSEDGTASPAPPPSSVQTSSMQPSPGPPPAPPAGNAALSRLLPLLQEMGGDSNARRLVEALRPYLRPRRQEKVERALQLARLYVLAKRFLSEWGEAQDV